MVRLLARRFKILEKIRIEAQGGQEEEDMAKDPTAGMTRERWPAPCWKVRLVSARRACILLVQNGKMFVCLRTV